MTPYFADEWLTIYGGDCRTVMAELPAESVDCVVTSPPYWGLRDYGNDGQLGLERTPEEYVANLVAVFREVRRVLKATASVWLNLGDSFMPGKQMAGIPWRVAFALQADGWYLRSDIIWSKPNPMPESVTDRPTKAHEYLFLLTKSARYYFDADAVREADSGQDHRRAVLNGQPSLEPSGGVLGPHSGIRTIEGRNGSGRNLRSVWTIATRPYPGAHFAVFPPELPERCIKAGSSERGVCPECGAPWERVVERGGPTKPNEHNRRVPEGQTEHQGLRMAQMGSQWLRESTGWRPTCVHVVGDWKLLPDPVPATILDPFAGSGTVGLVANRLSRRAILIDLNPDYLAQQMARNAQTPLGLGA